MPPDKGPESSAAARGSATVRRRSLIWIGLALFTSSLFLFPGPAQARIVAILFDDSRSMDQKSNLPAYGAQLIVSTLETGPRGDVVITALMSDVEKGNPITVLRPRSSDDLARLLERIKKVWSVPEANFTPYEQIVHLLEKIAELQEPGEEAHLIVLTDGVFNVPGEVLLPDPRDEKTRYSALRNGLKGPLRVDFLLIGPETTTTEIAPMTVGQVVEEQGYRDALLAVFNGEVESGRHDVNDSQALLKSVNTIVAQTSSIDRAQMESRITRRARSVTIDAPLSVHRIIAVNSADDPARLASMRLKDHSGAEIDTLASAMLGQDSDGAWRGKLLSGQTARITFPAPLPPGKITLELSHPAPDLLLLFETRASLELTLVDQGGQKFPQGANGLYAVPAGSRPRVFVEIFDEVGGSIVTVPPSQLGDDFDAQATLFTASTRTDLPVMTDPKIDRLLAEVPTGAAGTRGQVDAQVTIAGLSAYSKALHYEVLDTEAKLTLNLAGVEPCDACGPGEWQKSLTPTAFDSLVGRLELAIDTEIDGLGTLELEHGPGLVLTGPGGAMMSPTFSLSKDGANRQEFELHLSQDLESLFRDGRDNLDFNVTARALPPLTGEATLNGRLHLRIPDPELVLLSHSSDDRGKGALDLTLTGLLDHQGQATLEVRNVMGEASLGQLQIEGLPWPIAARTEFEGHQARLDFGTQRLCVCFLNFYRGAHDLTVTWSDPLRQKSAAALLPTTIRYPLLWSGILYCLLLILLLALAIYFFFGLVKAIRCQTFPKGSGMDTVYGHGDPRFREFPSGWPSRIASFFLPFRRNEQCVVRDGLTLRARRGGVKIDLRQADPHFQVLSRGGLSLQEIAEDHPRMEELPISWNDSLESHIGGHRALTFLLNASDRRGKA